MLTLLPRRDTGVWGDVVQGHPWVARGRVECRSATVRERLVAPKLVRVAEQSKQATWQEWGRGPRRNPGAER